VQLSQSRIGHQIKCGDLAVAGSKGPCGHYIALPLTGVGRRMGRKRQKLVGQDKSSLTEQQTKGTVTTTILIRRICKTNGKIHKAALTTQCPVHS